MKRQWVPDSWVFYYDCMIVVFCIFLSCVFMFCVPLSHHNKRLLTYFTYLLYLVSISVKQVRVTSQVTLTLTGWWHTLTRGTGRTGCLAGRCGSWRYFTSNKSSLTFCSAVRRSRCFWYGPKCGSDCQSSIIMANYHYYFTWSMMSSDPERSRSWPEYA